MGRMLPTSTYTEQERVKISFTRAYLRAWLESNARGTLIARNASTWHGVRDFCNYILLGNRFEEDLMDGFHGYVVFSDRFSVFLINYCSY